MCVYIYCSARRECGTRHNELVAFFAAIRYKGGSRAVCVYIHTVSIVSRGEGRECKVCVHIYSRATVCARGDLYSSRRRLLLLARASAAEFTRVERAKYNVVRRVSSSFPAAATSRAFALCVCVYIYLYTFGVIRCFMQFLVQLAVLCVYTRCNSVCKCFCGWFSLLYTR